MLNYSVSLLVVVGTLDKGADKIKNLKKRKIKVLFFNCITVCFCARERCSFLFLFFLFSKMASKIFACCFRMLFRRRLTTVIFDQRCIYMDVIHQIYLQIKTSKYKQAEMQTKKNFNFFFTPEKKICLFFIRKRSSFFFFLFT